MYLICRYCSGVEHLSTYMKIYKVGDIVDVKVCY